MPRRGSPSSNSTEPEEEAPYTTPRSFVRAPNKLYLPNSDRYIFFDDSRSRVSYDMFRSMSTVVRPGVGVIEGRNVVLRNENMAALGASPSEQRGYRDPVLGWVPLGEDSETGEPFADPALGDIAPESEVPPTDGVMAGTPADQPQDPVQPGITADGQVISPNPAVAQVKWETAVANARDEILRDREARGITTPITNYENRLIQQDAEARATRALNAYVGGNPANAPMEPRISPLNPNNVAEFKEGQFLPQFTGTMDQGRRLTAQEKDNLNFLVAGEVENSKNVLARLLNPNIPQETKVEILTQITNYRTQVEQSAQTAQNNVWTNPLGAGEGVFSSWNPLTWGVRLGAWTANTLLTGVGEAYTNYVDPSATWAYSRLPGGPRPATWDEARSVAPGQMLAATGGNAAVATNVAQFAAGLGLIPGLPSVVGLPIRIWGNEAIKGTFDVVSGRTDAPWTGIGDDIYNQQARERAFEENRLGSWTSGSLGAQSSLVWDPLNVIGPTGKFIRVSHRLGMGAGFIKGPSDIRRFVSHLDAGESKYIGFDVARKELDEAKLTGDADQIARARAQLAEAKAIKDRVVRGPFRGTNTLTKFGDWILDPANGKRRSAREILNHSVIAGMPNASEFAVALSRVRTFEEYSLVMRSAAGDAKAASILRFRSAQLADEIENIQLMRSADNVVTSPTDYTSARRKVEVESTSAISEFERFRNLEDIPGELVAKIDDDITKLTDSLDSIRVARALGADPAAVDRLWKEADTASDILRKAIFGDTYSSWSEETRQSFNRMFEALNREKMLEYAETGRMILSADEAAYVSTRLDELRQTNAAYDLALKSQMQLWGNRVNFGTGNWQAGAKWREGARQARAERRSRQLETHRGGQLKHAYLDWVPRTFDNGRGGTVSVWGLARGARDVVADLVTRPFTYAAAESPAGYLNLKGIDGAQGYREVVANFDSLRMYADPSMAGRKAYLLDRYVRNMNDPQMSGVQVVEALEEDILFDMVRFYGGRYGLKDDAKRLSEVVAEMRNVYSIHNARRAEMIKQITEHKFWKDEAGNEHRSPALESQLVESMPLMDFKRMERLTDNFIKAISQGTRIERRTAGWSKIRPFQKGVDRAQARRDLGAAELSVARAELEQATSLAVDPKAMGRLARQGNEAAQVYTSRLGQAQDKFTRSESNLKTLQDDLTSALEERDRALAQPGMARQGGEAVINAYDYFETMWRASVLLRVGYPVRNTIDGIARRVAFEASILPLVQDAATGARNTFLNVVEGRNVPLPGGPVRDAVKDRNAASALKMMESTGKVPRRVRRWVGQEVNRMTLFRDNQREIADWTQAGLERLRAARADVLNGNPSALDMFDMELYEIERNIRLLDAAVADANRKIASLEDATPADLIAAYRQSLDRPRRVGQEMVQGVDGRMYWGARSDPRMAEIMEQAASAGETVQATLGINLTISRSMTRAASAVSGGIVNVNDANYFDELTRVLNYQVRNSVPGRMWLEGASVDEIAAVLMDPERGKRYRDMVKASRAKNESLELDQMRADRAASKARPREMREATERVEGRDPVDPRDRAVVETDADRSVTLLRTLEVPNIGWVDEIADVAAIPGRKRKAVPGGYLADPNPPRTVHITLRDPNVGRPADVADLAPDYSAREVADAVKAAGLGFRVSVLKDGRTVSVTLPRVTENMRAEALERMRRAPQAMEQQYASALEDISDGLSLIHDTYRLDNIDDALRHAQWLSDEFSRYVPSERLRKLLANGQVKKEQIESLFKTPEEVALLPREIHGTEIRVGTGGWSRVGSFADGLRDLVDRGFRKFGTLPEDRLVRMPFMSQRYREIMEVGSRVLNDAYPDGAPAWAVEAMVDAARKRAVKDTNDYFYTQPRRTNFGRVFERFVPFISAWQNSLMAYMKFVSLNPEITMYAEKIWRAPDQMGITDSEGNVRVPVPSWLAGKTVWLPGPQGGMEVPLAGVIGDEWVYSKDSIFVVPQAVNPVISWKAGPIMQMGASTVMQAGWAGPVVPAWIKAPVDASLGAGVAQKAWDAAMMVTFGVDQFGLDEGKVRAAAASEQPLGVDKALPPDAQKFVQWFQASFGNSPENAERYMVTYMNIAEQEMLRYFSGARDTEPTRNEIRDRANGLTFIQGLTNRTGFTGGPFGVVTPPQADFDVQGLTDLYRLYQDTFGFQNADAAFTEMFGDEVLVFVKSSSTRGVAPATVKSLERSEQYQGLISAIAPRIQDTNLLQFVLTDGTETQADYNPNVRVIQKFRDVPGTTNEMRVELSPEQSLIESMKSNGWQGWIKFKESQQAELDARGLSSIQSNGAEDIRAERKRWLDWASQDPAYRDWFADYNDGFANRFLQSVDFLRTFTGDEKFMSDVGANPTDMWMTAQQWLDERTQYFEAFNRAGENDTARKYIRDQWADRANGLARTNPRFYTFWQRFLDEDDLTKR